MDGRAASRRIAAIGWACCGLACVLCAGLLLTGAWFLQPDGGPQPADFLAFHAASQLVLQGEPLAVYDAARMHAQQDAAMGRPLANWFPWFYPPVFLLAVAPLALLPYGAAWLGWVALQLAGFVLALRPVLGRLALPVALGAPATTWCVLFGQNGFLTAGLMTATLALLDRRPWLAGLPLGLLTCKPQFGVLFALVLVATRRWRTVLAAAGTALLLAAAVVPAFGWQAWPVFLAASRDHTAALLLAGMSGFAKLQSLFAVVALATGDSRLALALHGLAGLGIAALVLRLWLRPARPGPRAAGLMAGALLLTPHAFVYDSVVLVGAAAFLLRDMLGQGAARLEYLLVGLALLLPAALTLLGPLPGPLAGLILLGVALRRGAMAAAA